MKYLDDDIVDLRLDSGKTRQFYWGDACEDLGVTGTRRRVRMHGLKSVVAEGFIKADARLRDGGILRLSMVDVQQGDGLVLDTPGGKVVLIDGGDNVLFARHVAARYAGTTAADPLVADAVIVTHGDADHFDGLNEFGKSETHATKRKRMFLTTRRVYHNGLAKRPGSFAETAMFGATKEVDGRPFVTELIDDVRTVQDAQLNVPFKAWKKTVTAWGQRLSALTGEVMLTRRLDQTTTDAFDFLAAEGVHVDLLGPITEDVGGGVPGLAYLTKPQDDANLMLGLLPADSRKGWSASHTVNGHSISMRLRYGNVRFLFTGDLNQESMARLRKALPDAALRSEILKTPHHGAADFDYDFLEEVGPVVSMISSGDESAAKEHIHPRATLMAALGKASRTVPAVIFVTELAAFFTSKGVAKGADGKTFWAFERTNFGIIHVRTDGERVLAFTHSGEEGMNEAYRFTVSSSGKVAFAPKVSKRSAPPA